MKSSRRVSLIRLLLFSALLNYANSGYLFAQDKGDKEKNKAENTSRSGPLAQLPSKPGAHIEKINKLGDNEWVNLGAPKADPKWGRGIGRSYGAKALIMDPNLRGAYFAGEGRHNFIKENGFGMDDFWFYDINSHQWICLYPGIDIKNFNKQVKEGELQVGAHGLLQDKSGDLVPIHVLTHAWHFLTFDTHLQKLAFQGSDGLDTMYLPGGEEVKEGLAILNEQRKKILNKDFSYKWRIEPGYSLWYYNSTSGKFEKNIATGSWGQSERSFPQLHYIAKEKKYILIGVAGTAYFDPSKNQWTEAGSVGPKAKSYDATGCYDSKRDIIYSNDGCGDELTRMLAYDMKTGKWTDLKPNGTPPVTGDSNVSYFEYDADLDKVIAIQYAGKGAGIFLYDPTTNTWEAPLAFPKDFPERHFACNTCYDPLLNVYFCISGNDSEDNCEVWAYRLKKK